MVFKVARSDVCTPVASFGNGGGQSVQEQPSGLICMPVRLKMLPSCRAIETVGLRDVCASAEQLFLRNALAAVCGRSADQSFMADQSAVSKAEDRLEV